MKRHITRAVALVMTLMMMLTSVPYAVLPVFASAISGTTTDGEEGSLDGFELIASQATLGKEYNALGESPYLTDIVHTDGVVDDRISAYEPNGTTNSLDPFLIGGDAWINLDEIYYGAPAMPTYALSAWSANTSVVNTTHYGMEDGHWTYTFPDMDLITAKTWGNTLIMFDYASNEWDYSTNTRAEVQKDFVGVEGVVSSNTADYVVDASNGVETTAKVVAKNSDTAYVYNRYDDMQAKWGITMDKNTKSVTFTPANKTLYLSNTPYLYFSNEQTADTKMAISLLIGTPVIDKTAGIVNGVDCNNIKEPGVVHVYKALSADMDGTNPGRAGDELYAMLEIGDMFLDGSTYTYIKDQATLDSITKNLPTYTVDGQAANVALHWNQTVYQTDENGDYVYEYKWYTVTDNKAHPGVENKTMDSTMVPTITTSGVVNAEGKFVITTENEDGTVTTTYEDYVTPDAGYVTGAVTGCIDFTHILDVIYSYDYTGITYDVAKVRVDMADVDANVKTAGRINYLYFAPGSEAIFTPQVTTGVVEEKDNAIAEGWENGATVTITDTPNTPEKITIDTTGSDVYYDNEVDVKYMLYLQSYAAAINKADTKIMTEAEFAAAKGYSNAKSYNEYIDAYNTYLYQLSNHARLDDADFTTDGVLDEAAFEAYLYNLLKYLQGWANDFEWYKKNNEWNSTYWESYEAQYRNYLQACIDDANVWKSVNTRDQHKAAHTDHEDIDYVTVKIPVRKWINSLSDARKFTMKVNVTQWADANGNGVSAAANAVKKSNGEVATPTIVLWGSKKGAVGTGRSYWYADETYSSLNYGCRFSNDGMLAVLGNGVYLAEPRYWYESASIDRTLGNSTDYEGHESWYDLLRSPYMYDETITSVIGNYTEEMVGWVFVNNITVCVPKGTKLTITQARCSGNSAGMNMQDDDGDVVNAYDGGSGVNPVVDNDVYKGQENLTGTTVQQSGVNYSEKPAAYGPYLAFSEYTIGDLLDTDATSVYGQAWQDISSSNDNFHNTIYTNPQADFEKCLGRRYANAYFMVYATVEFSNGQKWGMVGVMLDQVTPGWNGNYISTIGWTPLIGVKTDGTKEILANQIDYRSTCLDLNYYKDGVPTDTYQTYTYDTFMAQWKNVDILKKIVMGSTIDKWTYSNMGGYSDFFYTAADGSSYGTSADTGKAQADFLYDASYFAHMDQVAAADTLVQAYNPIKNDVNGTAIADSTGSYLWEFSTVMMYANQWRIASSSNSGQMVGAYKDGNVVVGTPGYTDPDTGKYIFNDEQLYDGVHNFELTWPYEYTAVGDTGVDHRSKVSSVSEFRTKAQYNQQTSLGMNRTLSNPITVKVGTTSSSYPVLYYDMETTADSCVVGILVAMPRMNEAYGWYVYDDMQVWYIDTATNTLIKSVPYQNPLTGETFDDTTRISASSDSARNNANIKGGATNGYISLENMIKASPTGQFKVVGVATNIWEGKVENGYNDATVTTFRRLEVLYEEDAWLDDINYATVTDRISHPQLSNQIDLMAVEQNCAEKPAATTYRDDGTWLLERSGADSYGFALRLNQSLDTSVYRYLNVTVNSEVPFLISWNYENDPLLAGSENTTSWYSLYGNYKNDSRFTFETVADTPSATVPGEYQISLDLQQAFGVRSDAKISAFYIEMHGANGKLAIGEIALSKTAGSTVSMPKIDGTYDYNIRKYQAATTRSIANDSFNILNDAFYYNQDVNVTTAEGTVNDTGKRGWSANIRTHNSNYYSNGTDNDSATQAGTTFDDNAMNVIKEGGIDGVYQYMTSLGHLRMWMDPASTGSVVLNCDRTWDIQNYRYLYYSYSMRDDSGLAVEDNPNGSGIQLVLKTETANSGAAFVDTGDKWEYHTTYNTAEWSDGNTSFADDNRGTYGETILSNGELHTAPSQVNQCTCSKCQAMKGTEPEHSYTVSANVAVDLWDVYNQEKALSGAMNYANLTETTPSKPAETNINQVVFYIKNTLSTSAEFYINYIYLSNTPISNEMKPIFEMEEHQFYYLMDNTGTRYSARFPTLDNPTGQITGTTSDNRTRVRNNPVVVVRGDILEDAMFASGQGFTENDITDYKSMAKDQETATADEDNLKLYLKDGITMTEAVWFYENHFEEDYDGVQSASPDTDILDYYKYVKSDGTDGTAADMQWSLGRWYVSDGTDGLNIMKKDGEDVTGNLMKRYAVDNRVLLRSGIRPRTYTTYYDTQGGAMRYQGSSDDIKNGALVNINNYYITESPLNFFYTWPVDGPSLVEPVKPGYEFVGWKMLSNHGSKSPGYENELQTYHIKDVAQVDHYEAVWVPAEAYDKIRTPDKYEENQNKAVTATFYKTEDGLKMTETDKADETIAAEDKRDYTWFTRETSQVKAFKMTLPAASLMTTSNGVEKIYGWKMVTYDGTTITDTGKLYDLGATIWLTENSLFLPVTTPPVTKDENGNPLPITEELPTVTITLTNASLWTYVDGIPGTYVTSTGATQSINGTTITYSDVPRNALLIAVPAGEFKWDEKAVWKMAVDDDKATNVVSENGPDTIVSSDGTFVFAANADYSLTYTTEETKQKVWVTTNSNSFTTNREMKFYSQYTVDKNAEGINVVACGTLYTKSGSLYNNIALDADGNLDIDQFGSNMSINTRTITSDTVVKGSYQSMSPSNVRLVKETTVSSTNQYYFMVTVPGDKAATYYARGYVIYTEEGVEGYQVAYSDIIVKSDTVNTTATVS